MVVCQTYYYVKLFIIAIISAVRRAGRFFPPFSRMLFGLGRRTDIDEDNVHADFFDAFEVDENFRSAPSESLSAGRDDALHAPLGVCEHDVAHATEALSIR